MLPASGLLNIYGPPKAGKTYAALDLAIAVSDPSRDTFMEWPVIGHGPVWYLQLDMPRGVFHTEYLEPLVGFGCNINDVCFADRDIETFPYPFDALQEGKRWLRSKIDGAGEPPIALVIDTIRDAHGADENDSGVMRNVVTSLIDATMSAAPAIIIVSHEKKLSADVPVNLMSGNRGSNYIAGKMDAVMRFADGIIMAQGRTFKLTTLTDYKRNGVGLWAKFNENHEIARYLLTDFPSTNARHEAFANEWGMSKSTVLLHFNNYTIRGSFDRYPPALKRS